MAMKKTSFIILSLLAFSLSTVMAQSEYKIEQVSVIDMGDGRLLFRELKTEKPLQGSHRIIDGYQNARIEAEFKDGLYHGDYELIVRNNRKESGEYAEGRKNGTFKTYRANGKSVEKITNFSNGKLNGEVITFFTDGEVETEKEFKDGEEHGFDRAYHYETRELTRDMNYVDGVLHGKQMQCITSNVGNYTIFSNYKKGKLDGEYKEVFPDGKIRQKGTYKNGQKTGTWTDNR